MLPYQLTSYDRGRSQQIPTGTKVSANKIIYHLYTFAVLQHKLTRSSVIIYFVLLLSQ